jgi:serine/threonine protein kinase
MYKIKQNRLEIEEVKNKLIIENQNLMDLKNEMDAPVGKLREVRALGEGTYGLIQYVLDSKRRPFARKIFKDYSTWEDVLPSVMRELFSLGTFRNHPNIINYYDAVLDLDKDNCSVVLEYMDGNLCDIARLPQETRIKNLPSICHQMLSGLLALHEKDISHRDIKKENILYLSRKDKYIVKVIIRYPIISFVTIPSWQILDCPKDSLKHPTLEQ